MWFLSWPWNRTTSRKHRAPGRIRPRLEALEERAVPSAAHDVLYVGDGGDNSIQRFDAQTGASLGTFVPRSEGGLHGPRGMVFDGAGNLLVVNQDVNLPINGRIQKYDGDTGSFLGRVVDQNDPHSPFAPRGMVLQGNVLYVANFMGATSANGEVDRYDATSGVFLGALTAPASWSGQYNPRGVAFGPDGKLYVSVYDASNPNSGDVVAYNVSTGVGTLFASNATGAADLHRPEGLTFGPDGRLYITGFRADATDTDKIVILNAAGTEVDHIALDAVGQARSFGQAILFGPGGRLYVPITGFSADTGAVRSYDVVAKTFTNFVAPGTMGQPWYLTFGSTDAATLAYSPAASAALNPLATAVAQPLPTTTASTVASTSPPTVSAPVSGSTATLIATPSSTATPAAASASAANVLLFAAWGDDLFADVV
jgi:hypothetical protein